jgi:hypothetical protein
VRSVIGLGVEKPRALGRRPPDDLGGLLGLDRRPITPPMPPLYTPRMDHSNRPGPAPPPVVHLTTTTEHDAAAAGRDDTMLHPARSQHAA